MKESEVESGSHSVMSDSMKPHGLYSPWNCPGQNTGVGSFSLLQGIFPTQGSNPGFPHCRQILYHLSHKGSPRILEWVAYPFSSGSSRPSNWTGVSCVEGGFFTNWAMREFPISTNFLILKTLIFRLLYSWLWVQKVPVITHSKWSEITRPQRPRWLHTKIFELAWKT